MPVLQHGFKVDAWPSNSQSRQSSNCSWSRPQDDPEGTPPEAPLTTSNQKLNNTVGNAMSGIRTNMELAHAPGVVVAVVTKEGVIHSEAFGVTSAQGGVAVNFDQTVFSVASVSKMFTALAVLREVEKGRLALDADISGMAPELNFHNPFDQPITLRHLLTHSSGLDRQNFGDAARNASVVLPLGDYLQGLDWVVARPPGKTFVYDNNGYSLAGHLVELSSGVRFSDYVEENILKPLGMVDASFRRIELTPEMAPGHQSGQPIGFFPRHTTPAGMLTLTGKDMSRFMIAVLNSGQIDNQQVLSAESLEQATSPQYVTGPHIPRSYGYGFFVVDSTRENGDSFYHGGDNEGYQAHLEFWPDAGVGIFIVVNDVSSSRIIADFRNAIADSVATSESSKEVPNAQREAHSDHSLYLGEYLFGGISTTKFDRIAALFDGGEKVELGDDGRLMISGAPYVEVAPGEFRREDEPRARICFGFYEGNKFAQTLSTSGRTYVRTKDLLPIHVQRLALVIAMGTMLLGVVFWSGCWITSFFSKRIQLHSPVSKILLGTNGLLYGSVMVGIAMVAPQAKFQFGIPQPMYVLLALSTVSAVMAFANVGLLVSTLRSSQFGVSVKVQHFIFAVALVTMTFLLYHWNFMIFMT